MAGPALSVLDLIAETLSLLEVYAPGEPIDAADSATCLFTLQGIVDGWAAEPLTITSTVPLTFSTTPGKGAYTLGTDPLNDWVTTFLPPEITHYGAMIAGNLESGLTPLTDAQWAAVGLKTLGSTIAVNVWVQYGAAAHTVRVWPVPAGVEPIVLYCRQPVANFVAIDDAVVLRPGYREAIQYELTIKSAPKFGASAMIPAWLPEAWALAKSRIKEASFPALDMQCDPALTGRGGGKALLWFYEGR